MSAAHTHVEKFRHEALLYSGEDDFLASIVPFLEDGIAAGEPVLVVESTEKIGWLRAALDARADQVMFADMSDVGANPARIIPAWEDFVKRYGGGGKRLRGIGEPIWKERPPDELAESQRHEALLNVAFGNGRPWWLLCPYDTSQMDAAVIDEAMRSHEFLMQNGRSAASSAYIGIEASAGPLQTAMEQPPAGAHEVVFGVDTLLKLRGDAARFALSNGMPAGRVALFVTAVNEVATNSIVHGGGAGRARMWRQGDKLVTEVRDSGRYEHPLADRRAPDAAASGSRGLWLANQVCDLVQIRRVPDGTVFRLHVKLDPARPRLHVVDREDDETDGVQPV